MSFKSILTDLKTRVESNIQEALKPIDNLVTPVAQEAPTDYLRNEIESLTEERDSLVKSLALSEERFTQLRHEYDTYKTTATEQLASLTINIKVKDEEIARLRLPPCEPLPTSELQRRYESALQAIGELEEKLEEAEEEVAGLRHELKRKFSYFFFVS